MSFLTLEIPQVQKKAHLPLHINACSTQQYIDFCDLLYRVDQNQLSYEEFRIQAVYKLLNLKKGGRKIEDGKVEEALGNIYALSEHIDNFFTQNAQEKKVLNQDYTQNHIKELRPKWRKYHAPSHYFMDCYWG
ncbi:MAG: hypothetical protein CMM93_08745, partial [Rickettsiales bacterium]|nr:hypothetical protein [Rickettsiales bacterium]